MHKPMKTGLLIAYRPWSISPCTITPQGAWWPFLVGIGDEFLICYYFFILYAPSDACFICKFIQLSKICCCQDKYLTQVWCLSHCLSVNELSSAFLFLKRLRVVTQCVIDATSNIIRTTTALNTSACITHLLSHPHSITYTPRNKGSSWRSKVLPKTICFWKTIFWRESSSKVICKTTGSIKNPFWKKRALQWLLKAWVLKDPGWNR